MVHFATSKPGLGNVLSTGFCSTHNALPTLEMDYVPIVSRCFSAEISFEQHTAMRQCHEKSKMLSLREYTSVREGRNACRGACYIYSAKEKVLLFLFTCQDTHTHICMVIFVGAFIKDDSFHNSNFSVFSKKHKLLTKIAIQVHTHIHNDLSQEPH